MSATPRALPIGLACLIVLGVLTLARVAADSRARPLPGVSSQVRDGAAPPAPGTAVLAGQVVSDDEGHQPIRRALITISGSTVRGQRLLSTDDAGHFQLTGLATGTYTAVVSKPGYVSTYYGSRRPGRAPGTPFALVDGQRRDLTIPLMHGAVVTGAITDPFGRPLPEIRVSVLEARTVNGDRRLVTVPTAGPNGNNTDERGIYRLWGLPPGTFVVSAAPNGFPSNAAVRQITSTDLDWARQQLTPGRAGTSPAPDAGHTVGYATVYFPGVVDAGSASQIAVAAGEERSGIDFSLQLVPTAVLDGLVVGLDGQPVTTGAQVLLTRAQSSPPAGGGVIAPPFSSRGAGLDRFGKFSLAGVEPGQYTLTARGSNRPPGSPMPPPPPLGVSAPGPPLPPPPPQALSYELWATLDVSVSGDDLRGLVLTMRPGMTVSGRVAFEGTSSPVDDLTRVRVGLTPATNDGIAFNVGAKPGAANGTFTLTGVTPGRYRPNASVAATSAGRGAAPVPGGPTPWRLKSAMWQGRDLLDLLLDVRPNEDVSDVTLTFTDLTTELSGSLLTTSGDPASGYVVLVFPIDASLWLPNSRRIRQVQPAPDGTYKAVNLPSGAYYLGAVTDADSADLSDPSFLEQVAAASLRITITDGGKTVQNLRLKGGIEPSRGPEA
jgi:hypothetical protein